MTGNIRSHMWLAELVVPEMRRRRDGVYVIVSSIGGMKGSPVIGTYCLSKAADMQLVRNLSVEFSPDNIRFNCIAPGLVKTDFAQGLWDDPKFWAARAPGDAAQAPGRARGHRRGGGLPGLASRPMDHGPDHRRGRRTADRMTSRRNIKDRRRSVARRAAPRPHRWGFMSMA